MKNFDLAAAKAGAPVCTRSGKPARIVCWDMKWESGKMGDRIVYLTNYNGDEHLSSCLSNGAFHSKINDSMDLMMRDDNYAEKLARGEYDNPQTHKIIRRADIETENEFEQFEELRGYIQKMACIGQIPADWTGFISCLNSALRSGFDPTRPKEGDSSVKESLTVENPTCKESLPVDREYWRRVYAGEAMAARLASSGSWCMNETVKGAVEMADALLAELEK